jgi:signal transduction histidine kinase
MSATAPVARAALMARAVAPLRAAKRVRSTSLATRMIVASAVLAAIVAGIFTAFLVATVQLRHSTGKATRSKDVSLAALRLEASVAELETALRGYVLTNEPRFLEPLGRARRSLPLRITAVRRLAAGNPAQERRANGLAGEINSYADDYVVPLLAIARAYPAAARGTDATLEGKRRTDDIRARFRRFLAVDSQRVADSVDSANLTAQAAIALGAAGLAGTTLLVLVFGLYLARSIARPVRHAADGANRLATGDLSLRLSETGPGEIGELTHAFNTMAASLEESQSELRAQNEQLRESERVKSELVSIVSHEVRTPLASVLGFTSLLLQHDFDEDSRRRYLGIIDSQARRLAELVEDFLDVRRMEEGRLALHYEELDVSVLLREQAELFSGQSAIHELELELPPQPLHIEGDPRRLRQVVANLFSNAIKYSPDGGAVRVSAQANGTQVIVHVQDHGIGIRAEQHGLVFTKFFRGDAGARGISGTGLGLVLSREIVEAHAGEVGFDSSPETGSTFWFRLPVERPPEALGD